MPGGGHARHLSAEWLLLRVADGEPGAWGHGRPRTRGSRNQCTPAGLSLLCPGPPGHGGQEGPQPAPSPPSPAATPVVGTPCRSSVGLETPSCSLTPLNWGLSWEVSPAPSAAGCKVRKPAVEVMGVAVDFRPTLCPQRAQAVSCVTRGGVSGRNFAVTAGPTALTIVMSSTAVSPLASSARSVPSFCLRPRARRPEVGGWGSFLSFAAHGAESASTTGRDGIPRGARGE